MRVRRGPSSINEGQRGTRALNINTMTLFMWCIFPSILIIVIIIQCILFSALLPILTFNFIHVLETFSHITGIESQYFLTTNIELSWTELASHIFRYILRSLFLSLHVRTISYNVFGSSVILSAPVSRQTNSLLRAGPIISLGSGLTDFEFDGSNQAITWAGGWRRWPADISIKPSSCIL